MMEQRRHLGHFILQEQWAALKRTLQCSYKQNCTDDKVPLSHRPCFWNILGFRMIASFPKHFFLRHRIFFFFFCYFRKTYSNAFSSTNLETWASIKIESAWSCCVQQPSERTWGDFCSIIFVQQLARSNLHKILDCEFGLTFPKTFCERQEPHKKK